MAYEYSLYKWERQYSPQWNIRPWSATQVRNPVNDTCHIEQYQPLFWQYILNSKFFSPGSIRPMRHNGRMLGSRRRSETVGVLRTRARGRCPTGRRYNAPCSAHSAFPPRHHPLAHPRVGWPKTKDMLTVTGNAAHTFLERYQVKI